MNIRNIDAFKNSNTDMIKIISQGGVIWSTMDLGPGPTELIGGNMEAGFFGEVSTSMLIYGTKLASEIGLKSGIAINGDSNWLKFAYLGEIVYVAKKPFRHSVSWESLNAVDAVFGNRVITIQEKKYKIMLMKGKTEGKQNDSNYAIGSICHNSMWNRLMLPIHEKAPSNWVYPLNVKSPTENWNINYTDKDLITHDSYGYGSSTWCQEYGQTTNFRLYRGSSGVSTSNGAGIDMSYQDYGWRPVLELVQE